MPFKVFHKSACRVMTWGLLSLWLFFGGIELGEQLNLVVESVEAEDGGRDLDDEALAQLASGLKSDLHSLRAPCWNAVAVEPIPSARAVCMSPLHGSRTEPAHGPPPSSLRVHQQISVYRI